MGKTGMFFMLLTRKPIINRLHVHRECPNFVNITANIAFISQEILNLSYCQAFSERIPIVIVEVGGNHRRQLIKSDVADLVRMLRFSLELKSFSHNSHFLYCTISRALNPK